MADDRKVLHIGLYIGGEVNYSPAVWISTREWVGDSQYVEDDSERVIDDVVRGLVEPLNLAHHDPIFHGEITALLDKADEKFNELEPKIQIRVRESAYLKVVMNVDGVWNSQVEGRHNFASHSTDG